MRKTVGSAVVIALSVATIFYWFGIREPVDVEPAVLTSAPESSHEAESGEPLCLQRTDTHDVEITIQAYCERAGEYKLNDTLGLAKETRGGRQIVTGYDL